MKRKPVFFKILSLLLVMVLSVGGITAYFTDTDGEDNIFEVGKVSIELIEPSWEEVNITPNMTVPKDPQVYNDGRDSAFIYLEVIVPFAEVITANSDGTRNPLQYTELFSYEVNEGWVEIGNVSYDEEEGVAKHVYAYVGNDEATLEVLASGDTTPTLFDEILSANIIEGQGYEETIAHVLVNAYAIQSNNVLNDSNNPVDVWSVICNQLELGNTSGDVVMLSGNGQTFNSMAPSALSFRSSADIGDFKEVKINGATLDPTNYTKSEGSTIITLSIDYLKTLEKGNYIIEIVSETGSPSVSFDVVIPETNDHGFYYNQPYTADLPAFGGKTAFFVREDGTYDIITIDKIPDTGEYTVSENNISVTHPSLGTFNCTISSDGTEIYCVELQTTFTLGDESILADEDFIYVYNSSLNGYTVNVIDKTQKSYGVMLSNINNIPIVRISDYAFDGCTSMSSIEIPFGVMSIGNMAFNDCINLNSIEIPSSVTSIGSFAFQGCTNLNSISIPGSVSVLDSGVFADCTSLSSLVIPDSVANIKNQVFQNCTNLISISFDGTVAQWNAISKDETNNAWNKGVPATEVVCSDGKVTLRGIILL